MVAKILMIYKDQHSGYSLDKDLEIHRISLYHYKHKYHTAIYGNSFNIVLLMDGISIKDIDGTNDPSMAEAFIALTAASSNHKWTIVETEISIT